MTLWETQPAQPIREATQSLTFGVQPATCSPPPLPATPQGTPVVTNIYDNRDWLVRTLDPLQKAIQFTNDLAGRLIAATDPLSRTATFGHDANGRTIAATNAAGEITRLGMG